MNMATDTEKKRIHDAYQIIEVNGPPTSYFDLQIGDEWIQIRYRTIRFQGKNEQLVKVAMDTAIEDIKEALRTFAPSVTKTIWWRIRPEFETIRQRRTIHYQSRCRLATSPLLDEKFWARWEVLGGELSRVIE